MERGIIVTKSVLNIVVVSSLLTFSFGCVQNSSQMYHWGNYENLIYKSYVKPGTVTPQEQIDKLNEDIVEAQEKGKKVPPGLYAQLATMYYSVGNLAAADQALNNEKQLFPESTHFIDGIIERAQ